MTMEARQDAHGHTVDEGEAAVHAADDSPCAKCGHPFNKHSLNYADGITALERSRAAFASCFVCECVVVLAPEAEE
jgi:hypothetical protein